MPIVHVEMYPGRTTVQKEFLVRRIVDAVAEVAGGSREGVHVIIDEVPRGAWAMGPRLATRRTPVTTTIDPAHLVISTIRCKPGKREEYFAWRRDSVYPYMAETEGFISSTLLSVDGSETDYVIVNKWSDPEAQDRYTADQREADLRVEAREVLDQLTEASFEGTVVDVLNGGWGSGGDSHEESGGRIET